MRSVYISIFFLWHIAAVQAQINIYPAKPNSGITIIKNGTIHTGTGQVLTGDVVINNGKIEKVGEAVVNASATVIDATGKQVYPGLILANSDLGLKEIGSGIRGSNDYFELGEFNPNVRAITAYDADSRIINTLRSNGILLASVAPQGRLLTGSSSVVQLDAWTWEDALYKADNAMHLNMPPMMQSQRRSFRSLAGGDDAIKEGIKKIDAVEAFFSEAKTYLTDKNKEETNLKFESLKSLFEKKQKLFINAGNVRQILMAVDFARKFDVDVVIVGGRDSYLVADILKQNNIAVILNQLHDLPTIEDDDIDQPFRTPSILKNAGVLFALNDNFSEGRYRNLSFNAGTGAAYGLSKEDALQAITLNVAKILGIDDKTGSIEMGKDANIIIAEGDILDMDKSKITEAFIQGRKIDLSNKQTQLYERYKNRYDHR